jgi:hypothetical protein
MPWQLLFWLVTFILQVSTPPTAERSTQQRAAARSGAATRRCRPPNGGPPVPVSAAPTLPTPPGSLQSALLGCCMYQLIQLSDLESDFINPHDATRNINSVVVSGGCSRGEGCSCPLGCAGLQLQLRVSLADPARLSQHHPPLPPLHFCPSAQLPEYACQAALTALLLLSGRWAYGSLHALLLAYHLRQVGAARSHHCQAAHGPAPPAIPVQQMRQQQSPSHVSTCERPFKPTY